jgi:hypothetical protein
MTGDGGKNGSRIPEKSRFRAFRRRQNGSETAVLIADSLESDAYGELRCHQIAMMPPEAAAARWHIRVVVCEQRWSYG